MFSHPKDRRTPARKALAGVRPQRRRHIVVYVKDSDYGPYVDHIKGVANPALQLDLQEAVQSNFAYDLDGDLTVSNEFIALLPLGITHDEISFRTVRGGA